MPAVIAWPAELLRLTSSDPFLIYGDRSGGTGLNGVEQILSPGWAIWSVRLSITPEWEPARIKQFEALVTMMEGRRNIGAWPIHDAYAYDETRAPLQQPFSDGTWFSDGTGFTDGGAVQPMLTTEAAAAGARTIRVGLTDPVRPPLGIGDLFSIEGFLYRVTSATSGGTVNFQPDLRRDVPAGTMLATDPPVFYGRFESNQVGRRPRDLLSHGVAIDLSLVEAFDR